MNGSGNKWLEPPVIISVVVAMVSVGGFWVSFDRRVTTVEINVASTSRELDTHKSYEDTRWERVDDKLTKLLERGTE